MFAHLNKLNNFPPISTCRIQRTCQGFARTLVVYGILFVRWRSQPSDVQIAAIADLLCNSWGGMDHKASQKQQIRVCIGGEPWTYHFSHLPTPPLNSSEACDGLRGGQGSVLCPHVCYLLQQAFNVISCCSCKDPPNEQHVKGSTVVVFSKGYHGVKALRGGHDREIAN